MVSPLIITDILTLHFFFPIISILIVILLNLFGFSKEFNYLISLFTSGFTMLLSLFFLYVMSDSSWGFNLPLLNKINIILYPTMNLEFIIGLDSLSIFFVLLTNLFIYLCMLHAFYNKSKKLDLLVYLFILQWGVSGAFMIFDVLGFFIFFETTLIPIYLLILVFGSRERKVRASYMISLYTLFGSIFMFFNIIYLFSKIGTTNYFHLLMIQFTTLDSLFLWITFFIAFAAKIPMLPLHVWLPEAHVEAPTIGSVLLAVLLLKLGTYGILRFLLTFFSEATVFYSTLINIFALLSVLYTSLTAIRQLDIKKIIAYSSVGHMNVVLLGMLVFSPESLEGSVLQMLSHGIVSGALFFCVGSFYIRYKVRSLEYFGGFMSTYPLLSVCFLIFSLANISFPGTSNFIGEFMIMFGLFSHNSIMVALASINMITGAAYTLWAYNRIAFGNIKDIYIKYHFDLTRIEFYLYFFLTVLLFAMGLFPNFFLEYLHDWVYTLPFLYY